MFWSKRDELKRLCEEWLREPLVNPETGHPIERNGPTYQRWQKKCKELGIKHRPAATKELTWRKCQEWRRDPTINPDTGRKIQRDGPTYKWLETQCRLITEKEIELIGDYYPPDTRGMVPAVTWRGTIYIVRRCNGKERKVWGPLNKPAKDIKMRYYADTWDYTYKHYRPVFIGGTPSRPRQASIKKSATSTSSISEKILSERKTEKNPKYMVDKVIDCFVAKR
jgi:hypothetical protein